MAHLQRSSCCGILELVDIQISTSAEEAIKQAAIAWFNGYSGAFIHFSTIEGSMGSQISSFVKKHKLGTVTRMKKNVNRNTGNLLSMWVWRVNQNNFEKFYNAA